MQAHQQAAAQFKEHARQQAVDSSSEYICQQAVEPGSSLKAREERAPGGVGHLLDDTALSTNCLGVPPWEGSIIPPTPHPKLVRILR